MDYTLKYMCSRLLLKHGKSGKNTRLSPNVELINIEVAFSRILSYICILNPVIHLRLLKELTVLNALLMFVWF